VKAIGKGIIHSLKSFDIDIADENRAHLLKVDGDIEKAALWQLIDFSVEKNYCSAVAWKGVRKQLFFHNAKDWIDDEKVF
jgi:phosphopantetheinyl transferase